MKRRIELDYLENRSVSDIVTFGAPWHRGEVSASDAFSVSFGGKVLPLDSKITGYWPDGSVKWTKHNVSVAELKECDTEGSFILEASAGVTTEHKGISLCEKEDVIIVNSGRVKASFQKGEKLISDIYLDSVKNAEYGYLTYINEECSTENGNVIKKDINFIGIADNIEVEEKGSLSVTIRVSGTHVAKDGSKALPFIIRFIFTYNEPSIKMVHTFMYDKDAKEGFLKGLGISFVMPMKGELYNRHIKLEAGGYFVHEAMQLLSSWRPRLGYDFESAQMRGQLIDDKFVLENGHGFGDMSTEETFKKGVSDMTIWDSYKLNQDAPSHFSIKKRTGKDVCCYINCMHGIDSDGFVYISDEEKGMALGYKDFWQRYPSEIAADGLSTDKAELTAWIYSPDSEAFDFRHYDTVGHSQAYYEGFDEVLSTPVGIACTSEISLFLFGQGVEEDEVLAECSSIVQKPALLICKPEYYKETGVFGEFGLVDRTTPLKDYFETELDKAIEFYKNEVVQRDWYGLFNYGDFMHTYDPARSCWRYDMGGYAWQNTELVPTMWLWYAFLRTGREDIYTLAEAMSRHCSEVDVYHFGPYKGLGSRHNVSHWGCSCKEARIGMAGHHRVYYFLTGDLRIGEVLDEVVDTDFSTLNLDPLRKFYDREKMHYPTHARTGPDWSSYCSNWMIHWERTGDTKYLEKMKVGIEDLKKTEYKMLSNADFEYEPETGHLAYNPPGMAGGSHLVVCMGGAQVWAELSELLEDEGFSEMLAEYGEACINKKVRGIGYPYMFATVGAFAAKYYKDKETGQRVFKVLYDLIKREFHDNGFSPVMNGSISEIPWVSTNVTAQWCLNVIVCMGLIGEYMPENI